MSRRAVTVIQLQKQIQRYVNRWQRLLGLEYWRIAVVFENKPKADYSGSCKAVPVNERATVTFNVPHMLKEAYFPGEVEDIVVHELVHCIIWKSSERAVTQVTRSLQRVRHWRDTVHAGRS